MTHAELTYLLQDLALQAGAASFWYGPQTNTSINYNAPFPQAHLFPMSSAIIAGVMTTPVGMVFYAKDEHENAYLETDEAVLASSNELLDQMDRLAQKFYTLVADSAGLEIENDKMELAPVLRKGAQIGTGFWINFNVVHLGLCL